MSRPASYVCRKCGHVTPDVVEFARHKDDGCGKKGTGDE